MLHHLTGGWWGLPIRRILEAGSRTIRLMAVLFIPMLFGMSKLYLWANAGVVQGGSDPSEQALVAESRQALWFATLFTSRSGCCSSGLLNKWSREQDQTGDPALADRMTALSAPGLVLWAFVVTGAAIDWVMSLEPHWFSTIYGMLFIVIECWRLFRSRFSCCGCFRTSSRSRIRSRQAVSSISAIFLLAFVMLWAYLSFDQLLIIWAGNLKEEIPWYMERAFGGWAPVGVALIVLHFFVPFFLLLQRGVKRRLRMLSIVAAWIVVLTAGGYLLDRGSRHGTSWRRMFT